METESKSKARTEYKGDKIILIMHSISECGVKEQ
jgi:hypothetical protein